MLLASIALYSHPFDTPKTVLIGFPSWAGFADMQRSELVSYLFWFIGAPLVFGAIAWWYRRRGRQLGMRVAWPFALGVGLVVLVLLAMLAAMPIPDPGYGNGSPMWHLFLTPILPLFAATVAFGWVERSWGMVTAAVWLLLTSWPFMPGAGLLGTLLEPIAGGGGEVLGLHRPGPKLIAVTIPLVLFAVISGIRSRGTVK